MNRQSSRKPVFPRELTDLIDIACCVVDARMPNSTLHLEKELAGKELIVLNKADLVYPEGREAWVQFFRECGYPAFAVSSTEDRGFTDLLEYLLERLEQKREERSKLGITNAVLRLAVVGMPNVGKSSFINQLVREHSARTGDAPGVTKGHQWVSVVEDVQLLDTPGVIRRRTRDTEARSRRIMLNLENMDGDLEEHVEETVYETIRGNARQRALELYRLNEFPDHHADLFRDIARKRDYRTQGGGLNWRKALSVVMRDLQQGKLGKMLLEEPPDSPEGIESPYFRAGREQ